MSAVKEISSPDVNQLASLLEQNSEGILTCVHCGLCLPSCPTYRELGNENDSPRGRIYLMRGLVEGRIAAGDSFVNHIDLCLGCRACETVCPSGVPYGQLLEAARVEVAAERKRRGSITAAVTRFVLNDIFTRPRLLAAGFRILRLFRDSGLARLALETGLVRGRLQLSLALLASTAPRPFPKTTIYPSEAQAPESDIAGPSERPPVNAGILRGCVMEGLLGPVNRATERIIKRLGFETLAAPGSRCCGALHAHAGEIETARALARQTIDDFRDSDLIVVNSAGCGAAMKEYGHLLAQDPDYRERARDFSRKVKDVSEVIATASPSPLAPSAAPNSGPAPGGSGANSLQTDPMAGPTEPVKVAYDAPCHLLHAQKVTAPIDLLRRLPGCQLVPLVDSETCCGGAGIYNLINTELSLEILSKKIANIEASGARFVATGNPGCMMQIGAGLYLRGLDIQAVHPVELLDDLTN